MKTNSLRWSQKKDVEYIDQILQSGGVVVGPSDTVIGLLAPVTQAGVERLNTIKGRTEKPYIILVKSREQLSHYVSMPTSPVLKKQIETIMHTYWPGPLTLILPVRTGVPSYIGNNGTVAVRIPKHDGLLKLLETHNGLFSTSANKSGEPVPNATRDVNPHILEQVDGSIEDEQTTNMTPSTIIDCSGDALRLVREGRYTLADLERILGAPIKKS